MQYRPISIWSGYELEKKLLGIEYEDITSDEFHKKYIAIEFKYGKIDEATQNRMLANLIHDEKSKEQALLELDFKERKISETEYQKRCATIKDEPWVTVIKLEFGGDKSLEGGFELDWNDKFIEHLTEAGYGGHTPEDIVNHWFMTICKNIALEEFDGTGNFTADAEANLETIERWHSEPLAGGKRSHT